MNEEQVLTTRPEIETVITTTKTKVITIVETTVIGRINGQPVRQEVSITETEVTDERDYTYDIQRIQPDVESVSESEVLPYN